MFEGDALRSLRCCGRPRTASARPTRSGFRDERWGLVRVTDASRLHDRADLDAPGSCTFVAMEGPAPHDRHPGAGRPQRAGDAATAGQRLDRNRLSLLLAVSHATAASEDTRCVRERRRRRPGRRAGGRPRDRPRAGTAARGAAPGPVWAFGEIALTGRLRPVTQPERGSARRRASGSRSRRDGGRLTARCASATPRRCAPPARSRSVSGTTLSCR